MKVYRYSSHSPRSSWTHSNWHSQRERCCKNPSSSLSVKSDGMNHTPNGPLLETLIGRPCVEQLVPAVGNKTQNQAHFDEIWRAKLADLMHCQQTSSGYKIKHGKHAGEQTKAESMETKQYQDMLYNRNVYGQGLQSWMTIDWCCFYYFIRNSLVALLEVPFARKEGTIKRVRYLRVIFAQGP